MTGLKTSIVVGRTRWTRFNARFDWPLFAAIALICGLGLLNLYSALSGRAHQALFVRQIVWMGLGLALYVAVTVIDYRVWSRFAWMFLAGVISLIGLVAILGSAIKGSNRWLDLGLFNLQPSEIAKVAVILGCAQLAHETETGELPLAEVLARVAALVLPVALVLLQPDLGSASLILFIVVSVGYMAMRSVWLLNGLVGTGIALVPLMWDRLLHQYQKDRVLAFLDPEHDPTGVGWHTRQSILAVGSGRVTGEGYLEGTQNQFRYLPEQWTDFPFSVWAEEWGFIGCLVLLALYLFLLMWILNAAMNARDRLGAVLCLGTAAMVFWHVVVNIAMVLGLAPVVGVTLPLVSYGGSSILTIFLALGLVSSVSARRHGY